MPTFPHNPQPLARTAGLLYLLIAIAGGFSIMYVPSKIVMPGDAEATMQQLVVQATLFRAGILADFFVIAAEIALTAILYTLLAPVSMVKSMVAAMARFTMVGVMALNVLLNATAFLIAQGTLSGSTDLVLTLLDIHALGVFVWGVLFGVHLYVLGGLVCRSGYFPKLFGGALLIGAFGYILEGVTKLTGLDFEAVNWLAIGLLTLVSLAEISFAIWLLVKGVHTEKWHQAINRPA